MRSRVKQRTLRLIFLGAGVLIVWGSLAYRMIKYANPMDRTLAVCVGVGVTVLAVLILRGPVLPKSSRWDVDGTGSSPGSDDQRSHGGNEGHGGADGNGH